MSERQQAKRPKRFKLLSLSIYFADFKNFKTVYLGVKAEDAQRREKNLEEAKKIVIKEDPSLPPAKPVFTNSLYRYNLYWFETDFLSLL